LIRYPGEAVAVVEEAAEALDLAGEVVEEALARLPVEVRP